MPRTAWTAARVFSARGAGRAVSVPVPFSPVSSTARTVFFAVAEAVPELVRRDEVSLLFSDAVIVCV
ncbi:hypothetical protein GCM10017752_12920 [Streptomyces roseoviridis]